MRHELGYHQGMESIQPSNGRFYSLQPPPPGPATPGGSLAARGRPQCRSGPRAPAHPGGGGGGGQEEVTNQMYYRPARGRGRRGLAALGRAAGPQVDTGGASGG